MRRATCLWQTTSCGFTRSWQRRFAVVVVCLFGCSSCGRRSPTGSSGTCGAPGPRCAPSTGVGSMSGPFALSLGGFCCPRCVLSARQAGTAAQRAFVTSGAACRKRRRQLRTAVQRYTQKGACMRTHSHAHPHMNFHIAHARMRARARAHTQRLLMLAHAHIHPPIRSRARVCCRMRRHALLLIVHAGRAAAARADARR